MGDLIVMSRAKLPPARDLDVGHSAEILFFTGVRYYRMDEAEPVVSKLAVAELVTKRRRSPDQRRVAKLKREQRLEA